MKRKLTSDDIQFIYDRYWRTKVGKMKVAADLAEKFGVSYMTIRKIVYDPLYRRKMKDLDDEKKIPVATKGEYSEVKTFFVRRFGERPKDVPDGWEIYVSENPIAGHLSWSGVETVYGSYYAAVAAYKSDAARVRYFIAASGGVLLKYVNELDIQSWAERRGLGDLEFSEMKRVYFRSYPRKEINFRLYYSKGMRKCRFGCGFSARNIIEIRRHENSCNPVSYENLS